MTTGAEGRLPALQGQDISPHLRSAYNPDTVIVFGGGRSQNIGCNHAANAVVWGHHYDQAEMHRAFDAWLGYAQFPFMAAETFSDHIYCPWIIASIAVTRGVAEKVGRQDVADALLPHLKTFRCLAALSSGWERHVDGATYLRGYPVQMCGARSFASHRDGHGNRRDAQGRPNRPWDWMVSRGSFASYQLMRHLLYPVGATEDSRALYRLTGNRNPYGTTESERRTLRRICRGRAKTKHYERAVRWVNEGPEFAIPARIVRTDKAVAWVNMRSVSPGSTSFKYAKIWYAERRPRNSYWDTHHWDTDPRIGWVAVDPSMRTQGRSGVAELDGKTIRAQRRTGDWFDTRTEEFVPGWFEVKIPGEIQLQVRVRGNVYWRTRPKDIKAEIEHV